MSFYDLLVKFPIRLFFVLTPVAAVAVFLGLTSFCSTKERIRVAVQSTCIAFVILIVAALTGPLLFVVFNLTAASFQIAGGVYLAILGHCLLCPSNNDSKIQNNDVHCCNCAITPLAMPLLAGPGTISYIFLVRSQLSSIIELICMLCSIFFTMLIIAVTMILVAKAARAIPDRIITFLSTIMGVVIMCMGVQIIITSMHTMM